MPTDHRQQLRQISSFPSLVKYLRDELDWPIETDDFDDLTFDYEPEELGIDAKTAAKIDYIKQLRPLEDGQPWGIFFVKFEPKRLPVVALRRILGKLVFKQRASVDRADRPSWNLHDLLFISAYGEGDDRQISLAHFTEDTRLGNLATLKVLGWDGDDANLRLDYVHHELHTKLRWPTPARPTPGAKAGPRPSPSGTGRSSPRRRNWPSAWPTSPAPSAAKWAPRWPSRRKTASSAS
jgi:hypothetical protein